MFASNITRKSRFLVVLALATLLVFGGFGFTAKAAGAEELVLRLGHVGAVDSPKDQVCRKFAELVAEKTNGKVKIEIFPGGQLGSWREMIEQVKGGMLDIHQDAIPTLETYDPIAAVTILPFVFDSPSHYTKVMQSPAGQEYLDEITKRTGFKVIAPYPVGFRYMTVTRPIFSVEDLKGLKLRTPPAPVYTDYWRVLGASPVPIDFTEVFLAIQQGVVDGQENPLEYAYSEGFYEVAKYIILTGHALEDHCFVFWNERFEALPPDVQKGILEAGKEVGPWATELALKIENEYLEIFKNAGNIIIWPNRASFQDKLEGYIAESYPDAEKWVDKFRAVK